MKSDENSTPIPQQTVQGNLPSPYADDTVVQAFAGAVDGMLAPVDPVLASMADNYQAFNAPAELLPYLVQVSGARVEPGWPERAVRAAIDLAGWLATHRGTPAGLLTEARIVYGWLLEIDDPGDVHLPGDSTQWPDHTPLYVTMEPRTTGKAPISYDQSTLERLVEAHIPASLTYQIVPSTDHIALYDDPYCTGRAWLVYSDTPDLQVLNADNRASSAWNRTSSVIALYKDTNFLGTNEFIQPNSKADQLNLDNQASSLRFLTNVPADAWGLYDQRGGANGSGQLIGVYHGTRTNLLNTAGGKAVSLVNNTSHTLQLFNADRSTFQMVYPGLTADLLDINLVHALDSVVDHATVPNGAYCLYEEVQQGGKSWLFWDDSDQPIDLTDPQIAAHPVCSVYNNTTRTLQLLNHTGDDQLFYPQAYNSVSTALNQTTTTATLYDGAPDDHFCLYEGPAQTGRQWVFKDTEALTHLDNPTINAANAISSVDNKTIYTLELFQNADGTGTSQLIYPQNQVDITTPGLDNTATSVNLYHTPPPNYFALYSDFNQSGMQWVFKDTEGLTDITSTSLYIGAALLISSVCNRTSYTIELFSVKDGSGLSQLVYPGTAVDITAPGLDNNVKSFNVYHAPPNNYFCLYENTFCTGRQWVFRALTTDPAGVIAITDTALYGDASSVISSVSNQTWYTIELFSNNDGTGTSQLVYPDTTVNVYALGLENRVTSVNVYHGPPANYFCFFEHTTGLARQWLFKDTAGLTSFTNTAVFHDLSSVISRCSNQTKYTLEMFQNANGTGTSQLVYPGTNVNVTTPGLEDHVTSANVYHGPPANYFCLYEDPDQGGTQWVFNDAAGLTDLTSANLGRPSQVASSIKNLTKYTLELFQWSGGTGTSQLVYPSTTTNYIAALDNAVNGVKLYHGPPNNYFCLYEGDPDDPRYRQWVFKDTAVLTDLTDTALFADASRQLSSARNLTLYTLELFQNHDGTGLSQLIYPGTDNIFGRQTPALNDQVKSVRVHNGPPTNYFALYEAANLNAPPDQNYRQWVFKDTDGLIDITGAYYGTGTNKGISSVSNQTIYTLELFQNSNGSGTSLLVYPSTTVNNVGAALNDRIASVYLYRNPRPGYFSLYEQRIPNQNTMRQWTFKDTAVLTDLTNTTLYGDIALRISTVNNQTNYTLELFKNNDGTGTSQLYYPATTVAVPPGSLEDQVKSVKVYNGPPANCFCLYGDGNYGGAQWVFKNAVGHVDLTNTSRYGVASGAISSARNNSTNAIEVFDQPSEHGKLQLIPPSGSISSVFGHLNDRIKSFTVYGALQFPTPCVVANKRSWKVVDVNNSSTTVGLTLQQWVHLGYNNQRWIIVPAGGGASRFHNVNSLLAMGVQGNSTSDSAKTTQEYPDADNPSQKWKIGSWDSYWLITNVRSNKVLDVSGGSTSNGAPVIQYKINWHDNQAWEFLVPRNP